MRRQIITISREFGSGGRTIGKEVAQCLGVPCYDKELVKQVATETGLDEGYVEQKGEDAPGSSWLACAFSARGGQVGPSGLSVDDFLWAVQHRVIRELAEKGPCVFVGRCADYILRERQDCLHVFVHADPEVRADRIVRLYGESEKKPAKRLEEKDKKRRTYYKYYTGQEWGMSQNYHLCLDSGALGLDTCVDLIVGLAEKE
ncbi:AAA family ATPase [Bittarella sp. HCP28S3_D9]|uniref:cytidylate kinase-like family protein n=1 Tax=Bittarella sp. HCP28S3_D9 TaxID=3440253 RepID=UPI003F8ADE1A